MLTGALLVRTLYGFVVGALCVCTLSVTADRFGSKLAGALGGFPASIAATFFFLAMAGGVDTAIEATSVIPISMGFFGVLLVIYMALIETGITIALLAAFGGWFLLTLLPVSLGMPPYPWVLTLSSMMLLVCWYLAEFSLVVPAVTGKKIALRVPQVASRMFAGGAVVSASVLMGALAGPIWGGISAAFPAVTVTTLWVTHESGGVELSRAMAKSMMVSGMVNATCFSIAVRYLYPPLGNIYGTIVAGVIGIGVSIVSYLFLRYAAR